MTVFNLAVVAFVAISLNGLFLTLALVYRREARKLRRRNAGLREELAASRKWNGELIDARDVVNRLVTEDPMNLGDQLPGRNDPLERLYRLPPFIPEHERGQQ